MKEVSNITSNELVIRVDNVSYSYPTTPNVLKDISFSVKKGEILGIIGPNGAGKSTLLKTLNGLVPHFYGGKFKGKVIVCGMDTMKHTVSELAVKVGLVFQDPLNQLSGVTGSVYEEVAFGLSMLGFPHETIETRVMNAIEKVGLKGLEKRSPYSLSGGQQQRLAIATVLALKPEVIVLDEPTAQLDPIGKYEVLSVLKELKKEGQTIVIAEHEIEELATFADRILVIENGKIIMRGSTREVLTAVEELKSIGVNPPSITELFHILKNRYGLSISEEAYPISLEEGIRICKELLEDKN